MDRGTIKEKMFRWAILTAFLVGIFGVSGGAVWGWMKGVGQAQAIIEQANNHLGEPVCGTGMFSIIIGTTIFGATLGAGFGVLAGAIIYCVKASKSDDSDVADNEWDSLIESMNQ